MKIVVDNKIPFIKGVLEKHSDVMYLEGSKINRDDLLDTDALIIRTQTKCNSKLLDNTGVRFIATATIGYDHIDTLYCDSHGIVWTNAAGCNASSVQQYIVAALFHLADNLHFSIAEKIIGIVGVGNVGSKTAEICTALGMRVLLNDPPRARREGSAGFVSLDEIVEQADIITFHVPLNYEGEDKTYHLVDEKFLFRMRRNQILINSSRGEVVDTTVLKSVLKEQRLAACVLDVWENEPDIDTELLGLVDIGTPHIAGYSVDGKANGTSMSVQALSRFFGLELHTWFPEQLPLPSKTTLEIDCKNSNQREILGTLVRAVYDIVEDDRRLRISPQTFEEQRGQYPLRREFPTYTVKLLNSVSNIESLIRTLGFKTP